MRETMNWKTLIFTIIFGALAFGGANLAGENGISSKGAQDGAKEGQKWLGSLREFSIDLPPRGKKWATSARLGDIIEVSVRPARDDDSRTRTIKIEVEGDSVAVVGDVLVNSKEAFCFFLKAVKVGDATVKIIPVEDGGKSRKPGEVVVHVDERAPGPGFVWPAFGTFIQVDTNDRPPGKPWKETAKVGDWIQFHVVFPKEGAPPRRVGDIKVEIDGDAVQKMGVLTMPVRTELSFAREAGNDKSKRNLNCLVKAVKMGEAKVTITPIAGDRTELPPRVILVEVVGVPNPGIR
jgi:hypothetical protein